LDIRPCEEASSQTFADKDVATRERPLARKTIPKSVFSKNLWSIFTPIPISTPRPSQRKIVDRPTPKFHQTLGSNDPPIRQNTKLTIINIHVFSIKFERESTIDRVPVHDRSVFSRIFQL
jgi:hypothetical protein